MRTITMKTKINNNTKSNNINKQQSANKQKTNLHKLKFKISKIQRSNVSKFQTCIFSKSKLSKLQRFNRFDPLMLGANEDATKCAHFNS